MDKFSQKEARLFGQRIAARMAAKSLTQGAMAKAAGVSQPTVNNLLAGKVLEPKAHVVIGMAKALGCTIEYLMLMDNDVPADIVIDLNRRRQDRDANISTVLNIMEKSNHATRARIRGIVEGFMAQDHDAPKKSQPK